MQIYQRQSQSTRQPLSSPKRIVREIKVVESAPIHICEEQLLDVDRLSALSGWSGLDIDKILPNGIAKAKPAHLAVICSLFRFELRSNHDAATVLSQIARAHLGPVSRP